MKLYVIAKKYDEDAQIRVPFVAGEFTSYTCAEIFREAYKKRFETDAVIVSQENLTRAIYLGL